MKKSDFYREIARVMDLCEAINIYYCKAIKYRGQLCDRDIENNFSNSWDLSEFTFAIAIIENRPVFVGDYLYNLYGLRCKITGSYVYQNEDLYMETDQGDVEPIKLSWKEPKKTFTLNGKELPSPKGIRLGYSFDLGLDTYFFKHEKDRDDVLTALHKLLR